MASVRDRFGHARVSIRAEAARQQLDAPVSLRALVAGATAPPTGEVSFHPTRWRNWVGLDSSPPGLFGATPSDLGSLVAAVEQAVRSGKRIRAVGAGHSTSTAARPDDIVLDLRELSGVEPARWLRPHARDRRLYTVGAGIRIKHLNRVHLPSLGLALPNMGSFDWQTLAGAVTTGTHGSGIGSGPLSDIVVSYDVVVAERGGDGTRVRAYRIEPTDGVTDRATFDAAGSEHGLRLVQDDTLFYASLVAFGSTGIIAAMTLELDAAFWLEEHLEVTPWSELRATLRESLDVVRTTDHYEFLVNAARIQTNNSGDPLCLVRRRNRVPVQSRPDDWNLRVGVAAADREEEIAAVSRGHATVWPPRRVPVSFNTMLAEHFARPRPGDGWVVRTFGLAGQIDDAFKLEAMRPGFFGDLDRSRSDLVLRRVADYRDDLAEPEPPPAAISNELAVAVGDTAAAVERLLARMRHSDWFYPIPFGVRFTAASPHVLAPQFGRETCMIEIPQVLPSRQRARERLLGDYHAALEELERELCHGQGHLDGRPHWGQYHALGPEDLDRLYPRVDDVRAARARFDAVGVFANAHTDQLGL